MSTLRVAAAAWKIRLARRMRGDSAYFGHLHDLVSEAHDEGAKVVVLPELHVLELLNLEKKVSEWNAAKYLVQYGAAIEEWVDRISNHSDIIIVGGSHFKETPDGIKNICAIGIPGEPNVLVEKNNLTAYEKDVWQITPGKGLAMLPEKLGVTVCYDSEFPPSSRALADRGMLVQCVPSWTETQRGYQRVRWSCHARAVEHTIFVIHSSLVGDLGREPVPASYGSAAILSPSMEPFPMDAVLRETPLNEEGVVIADLDFDQLEQARTLGEVRNWQDRDAGDWSVRPYEPLVKPSVEELN